MIPSPTLILACVFSFVAVPAIAAQQSEKKQENPRVSNFQIDQRHQFKKSDPVEFESVKSTDQKVRAPIWYLQEVADGKKRIYGSRKDDPTTAREDLAKLVDRTPDRVFGNNNFQHAEGGRAIAFSPDGKFLSTGGRDRMIRLFDMKTGELAKVLAGHFGQVESLAFVPNTRLLISSAGKRLRIWDIDNSKELSNANLATYHLAVSKNGKYVSFSDKLFEIESTNPFRLKRLGKQLGLSIVTWAHFVSNDEFLILGSQSEGIWAWELATNKVAMLQKTGSLGASGVYAIWLSKIQTAFGRPSIDNDELFIQSSNSQNAFLVGGYSQQQLNNAVERLTRYYHSELAISPNGQFLAGIGDGIGLQLFDLENNKLCFEKEVNITCSISTDGKWIASGGWDGTVRVRNVATGKIVETWKTRNRVSSAHKEICRVRFAPDRNLLVFADDKGTLRSIDMDSRERSSISMASGYSRISDLVFDVESKTIATTGGAARMQIVNYDFSNQKSFDCKSSDSLAFEPNSRHLIFGNQSSNEPESSPRFWNIDSMLAKPEAKNEGLKDAVFLKHKRGPRLGQLLSIDVQPEKQLLAVADWTSTIYLWSLKTKSYIGKMEQNFGGLNTIRFLPGTSLLAAGGASGIMVWDTTTMKRVKLMNSDCGAVRDISVHVNDNNVASIAAACSNGTVELWTMRLNK